MSDHLNCNNIADLLDETSTEDWSFESTRVKLEEKCGDELLIELYRERPFLYDKSNADFKNSLMKQNAWIEISKIMIQTTCDNMYTSLYCRKRCISLRDQYSREKRKAESKSAAATGFPFFSQLAFLDHVIKRRRRYTKHTRFQSSIAMLVDEDSDSHESQSIANESSNKENKSINKQDIHNINFSKENDSPKMKKQKVEMKELEQTLVQISNRILSYINYMEQKVSTVDDAFMEFIKVQFNSIPEKEKNIKRKMIMDILTAPLPEK